MGSGDLLINSENKACNDIFVKHLENNECHNTTALHVMLIRLLTRRVKLIRFCE